VSFIIFAVLRADKTMSRAKFLVLTFLLYSMTGICGFAQEPRVQDIPLPGHASDVTYVRKRGDIRFKVASDMKTAGEFYAAKLKEQQWTKSGKDNLQKNFTVQTYAKGNTKLEVRVDQRGEGCEIRLTPTGFVWDEDLAPKPKDLPIPEDAKEVKYDDFFERIEFQSATAIEKLAEFYVGKLDTKTWAKSGEDVISARSAQLKRTSGKASVTISIRREDDFNEVKITTKGMVWDDVKTANTAAKKEMEKTKDRTAISKKDSQKPVELPKRVDKPLKGIAKLEKQPSRCVITVDGTQVALPQIIAYEFVSQGRWRTRIVATDSALNLQPLLQRLKTTGSDEGWDVSPPFLKLELDDQDRAASVSLVAQKVPGGGTGNDLEADAIVEEGRARGTLKVKEQTFFDKAYSAEMTFDVPLLTRDSASPKRLANATKLANAAKLTIGGKAVSLPNVTIYETQQFDNVVTAVLLTERPINLAKLKASLAKSRNDDDFNEFQPQIKLVFNDTEQLKGLSIWCDGLSISSSGDDNIKASVTIEDGRARGTAKTAQPGETFGKKYDFEVSFDATVLALPATTK
jgi:hypothetical protein